MGIWYIKYPTPSVNNLTGSPHEEESGWEDWDDWEWRNETNWWRKKGEAVESHGAVAGGGLFNSSDYWSGVVDQSPTSAMETEAGANVNPMFV